MKYGSALFCILTLAGASFLTTAKATETVRPEFKVDPNWVKELPHGYFFGQIAGLTFDQHGNLWVISRPRSVIPQLDEPPQEASGVPAPSVMELDPNGHFLRGWGGPFMMSDTERS
ncbi:MAG TPA: hypothetical protein VKB67_14895, partial [Rhizomicrobium sp.]|nr:hypothetical protein [Rhizomicrobium sp.]